MDNNFGQHVKKLFNLCVDRSIQEQINLIKNSDYSIDVKQRVSGLLKHSQSDEVNLTQSILSPAKQGMNISNIQIGDLVENYRLLKPIGHGGQGEVWLANRDDGDFKHQVAIKFIKLVHNDREIMRFQSEREVLASLQHENITQLIGGGQFQNTRMYMVMEWIDGIPFIEYIQQKQFSLEDSLTYFLQVCKALSYAHKKGVIHRDIKPSNILITKDGSVKLLDFGIAKVIDSEVTETQSTTMLTLSYSSPEQVNGQPLTTATDIYSLGLVLYELLTGKKAYNQTTESAIEYIKTLSEITPDKPSIAVDEIQSGKIFSAKNLKGDIDNLVMMCLRKEPERRYSSVDELANDIDNFLQSKALIASGDSWSYKFKKLLKRNPLASIFATLAFILILTLPVIMYQSTKKIKFERNQAQYQAEIANNTSDFLTTLLESASPLGNKGEQINLDDVLEQGERQIQLQLNDRPKVKAKLLMTFGQIQFHLENLRKAMEYYAQAAELFANNNDFVGQLEAVGQKAVVHLFKDEYDMALATLKKADVISLKIKNVREIAWYLAIKSTIYNGMDNKEKALDFSKQALKVLQGNEIEDAEVLGRVYNGLSLAYKSSDKIKALEYNQKAIDIAELSVGKMHPSYQRRLLSKAKNLVELERYDEAQEIFNQTHLYFEKLYSNTHPRYAKMLAEQNTLWHNIGEFKKAEKGYKKEISIYIENYGKENQDYSRVINNLAYLYEDMMQYDKAKPLYIESLQLRKNIYSESFIRIASAKGNLARLLAKTGFHQQSAEMLESVIPVYTLNNRSNLYNQVIQVANLIKDGKDSKACLQAIEQIKELKPNIQQQSEKSWKRLGAELWLGEMSNACAAKKESAIWLNSALKISKNIYKPGTLGQKQISERIKKLL